MGLLGRQQWGGMVGIVCIGAPSLRNCPGARRPPREGGCYSEGQWGLPFTYLDYG